ncbi:MAG: hydrogenase nickel incorporation protein HypB [Deltaproteobacteria bacterium]|nr:hydrogenase nickel incorporation protein HypB [Deltaproteobacteria bacterium]
MCGTCGCGESASHGHGHAHESEARRIAVEESLLADNDRDAARLAASLRARGIDAIGLVGGPGAGKTTLLEATLGRLCEPGADAVVEGDCAGDLDARRIEAAGARVAQIETGSLCHLDAHLVGHAIETLDLEGVRRLWIENVGNLVCPAAFACGEARRVVLISVAEGDDKPEKYPAILAGADLLLITKSDLLPHVDFDVAGCTDRARRVAPGLPVLVLSARTGEGLGEWLAWMRETAPPARVG